MRSYKDFLVEYLETQTFKETNASWINFFLCDVVEDNSTFQLINALPPIHHISDIGFYADTLPADFHINHFDFFGIEKRSKSYKLLINGLIYSIVNRIHENTGGQSINFQDLLPLLNYPTANNYINFYSTLERFLDKYDLNTPHKINSIDFKVAKGVSAISLIDNFYDTNNYQLNKPKYEFNQFTTIVRSYTFDFDSHRDYNCDKDVWQSQIINPSIPFFKEMGEGLDYLNHKALLSPIRIFGQVNELKKIRVKQGAWYNQQLVDSFLCNTNKNFSFPSDDFNEKQLALKLQKSYSNFYTVDEFDITIIIKNSFSDHEINRLRNEKFSCFPFYLSDNHAHFKWIEKIENNNLKIRIKSKFPQTTIVGADIITFKNYVLE